MFFHLVHNRPSLCVSSQTDKTDWDVIQMDAAYRGRDFTATVMTANPDFLTGNGVYVLQYLQSLTPHVALGSELMVRQSVAMGRQGFFSLAAQIRYEKWRLAAAVGSQSIHASYVYKHNKNLQVKRGVEITGLHLWIIVGNVFRKGRNIIPMLFVKSVRMHCNFNRSVPFSTS